MHYYTYAYLREDRTPYYIGKGTGDRIYSTNRRVNPPKDKSRIIFLKQNLTEEEAFKHEIYMIAVFGRIDLGTGILHNMTNGGEGASGAIRSDETRKKLSEANKGENNYFYGRTHSEETKRKMSEVHKNPSEETRRKMSEANKGKNHPNYGKTASEESRKKMSEAKKGKTNSKEHNRKIIEGLKGRPVSQETRIKISEAQKGRTLSEETKKKMSEARKGRTLSEETKRKMSSSSKGKKCWNDGCGNIKYMVECPGDDWRLGRK